MTVYVCDRVCACVCVCDRVCVCGGEGGGVHLEANGLELCDDVGKDPGGPRGKALSEEFDAVEAVVAGHRPHPDAAGVLPVVLVDHHVPDPRVLLGVLVVVVVFLFFSLLLVSLSLLGIVPLRAVASPCSRRCRRDSPLFAAAFQQEHQPEGAEGSCVGAGVGGTRGRGGKDDEGAERWRGGA